MKVMRLIFLSEFSNVGLLLVSFPAVTFKNFYRFFHQKIYPPLSVRNTSKKAKKGPNSKVNSPMFEAVTKPEEELEVEKKAPGEKQKRFKNEGKHD